MFIMEVINLDSVDLSVDNSTIKLSGEDETKSIGKGSSMTGIELLMNNKKPASPDKKVEDSIDLGDLQIDFGSILRHWVDFC